MRPCLRLRLSLVDVHLYSRVSRLDFGVGQVSISLSFSRSLSLFLFPSLSLSFLAHGQPADRRYLRGRPLTVIPFWGSPSARGSGHSRVLTRGYKGWVMEYRMSNNIIYTRADFEITKTNFEEFPGTIKHKIWSDMIWSKNVYWQYKIIKLQSYSR